MKPATKGPVVADPTWKQLMALSDGSERIEISLQREAERTERDGTVHRLVRVSVVATADGGEGRTTHFGRLVRSLEGSSERPAGRMFTGTIELGIECGPFLEISIPADDFGGVRQDEMTAVLKASEPATRPAPSGCGAEGKAHSRA